MCFQSRTQLTSHSPSVRIDFISFQCVKSNNSFQKINLSKQLHLWFWSFRTWNLPRVPEGITGMGVKFSYKQRRWHTETLQCRLDDTQIYISCKIRSGLIDHVLCALFWTCKQFCKSHSQIGKCASKQMMRAKLWKHLQAKPKENTNHMFVVSSQSINHHNEHHNFSFLKIPPPFDTMLLLSAMRKCACTHACKHVQYV